jgi:hypothetical protein
VHEYKIPEGLRRISMRRRLRPGRGGNQLIAGVRCAARVRSWPIAPSDILTARRRFRGIADMDRFSSRNDLSRKTPSRHRLAKGSRSGLILRPRACDDALDHGAEGSGTANFNTALDIDPHYDGGVIGDELHRGRIGERRDRSQPR